jgi:hypothetical protein
MKKANSHISVILDRTGSMESIRDDIIGGFNTFLNEQKNLPDRTTFSLVQFDTQNPYEVIHQYVPITEVNPLTRTTYVPRAATPLLDAIGRGINDLESHIGNLKNAKRPSRVVLVIITDGQENSSREFRKDQIVSMIQDKKTHHGWQFVFLSADLDAIGDAMEYGFDNNKCMAFDKTSAGVLDAMDSLSMKIAEFRQSDAPDIKFSKQDRERQKMESKQE